MERRVRILYLEDNKEDVDLIKELLSAAGMDCEFEVVDTRENFEASLESREFDIILADYTLPSFDGLAALEIAKQKAPEIPFVFVTGTMGEDIAIESLKKGAMDYVLKTNLSRLAPAVKRAIEEAESRRKRKLAEDEKKETHERLATVLDGLDAIVYVSDLKTYELLFVNKCVNDIFGDIVGQPCWKAIQTGQSGPCAFCTNDKLVDAAGNATGIYHWEFQNTVNNRWYNIHDRALKWVDGRMVRMEIAVDITERKRVEDETAKQIEELRRWHEVTLGREGRIAELKREVNELLTRLGQNPKYETQPFSRDGLTGSEERK
jgi:hypothetical protein